MFSHSLFQRYRFVLEEEFAPDAGHEFPLLNGGPFA